MRSQRNAYADRIKNPATTEPTALEPHSVIAPPLRARRKYRVTRSLDRRNFEPNTAISGKHFYLRARTLRLSSAIDASYFAPCSLRRSSRNQTSSLSVSLGLGVRPVALCRRPSFISSMHPRHSKTLKLRYGAIMDGA
jgi:hypothetical protein